MIVSPAQASRTTDRERAGGVRPNQGPGIPTANKSPSIVSENRESQADPIAAACTASPSRIGNTKAATVESKGKCA